jgi:hypothetical protein
MEPKRELFHVAFLVDTNCVNARRAMPAMNHLEEWADRGLIQLLTAETAQNEMLAGGDANRSRKAYRFISTLSCVDADEERDKLKAIENVLFPGGAQTQNEQNDVDIVFNAHKYGRMLITNDGGSRSQPGGILGNREKLLELGVRVVTPEEAVDFVRQEIQTRDKYAREWAEFYGRPTPGWVGKD